MTKLGHETPSQATGATCSRDRVLSPLQHLVHYVCERDESHSPLLQRLLSRGMEGKGAETQAEALDKAMRYVREGIRISPVRSLESPLLCGVLLARHAQPQRGIVFRMEGRCLHGNPCDAEFSGNEELENPRVSTRPLHLPKVRPVGRQIGSSPHQGICEVSRATFRDIERGNAVQAMPQGVAPC